MCSPKNRQQSSDTLITNIDFINQNKALKGMCIIMYISFTGYMDGVSYTLYMYSCILYCVKLFLNVLFYYEVFSISKVEKLFSLIRKKNVKLL